MKKRLNNAQADELDYLVKQDILLGFNGGDVVRKFKNNGYGETYNTSVYTKEAAMRIYKRILSDMRIDYEGKKEELRKLVYERYTKIYNEAISNNDRTNAIGAMKEMVRLLGLAEPDRVQTENKIVIDFGFDDTGEDETETDQKSE